MRQQVRLIEHLAVAAVACMLSHAASCDSIVMSEDAMLVPSDGIAWEQFGVSCLAQGDTLVVGSYRDRDNGWNAGGVYIYERQADGSWGETDNLRPSDGSVDALFGLFMDIEDDRMLIGAISDSNENGTGAGSVYVFERGADGRWTESSKLIASDSNASDNFGGSVALGGRTFLAGAPLDDDNGDNSGSVYVFDLDAEGTWRETVKLHPSDAQAEDHFGLFVAYSGTTAIIGSPYHGRAGAAYVFERRANGTWRQKAKLVADDAADGAEFGGAVAIESDTIMIGAPSDDDLGARSGSMYVFERGADGRWRRSAKLLATDGNAAAQFGRSLDLYGDAMVVGSPNDDDNGPNSGSAYLFKRHESGTWLETTKFIATDGNEGDMFGSFSPALADDWLLVGSRYDDANGVDSGSAYVFDLHRAENIADIASSDEGPGVPDGIVDGDDLLVLFSNWGPCQDDCAPGTCSGDLNGDCIVDGADLELMLGRWSVDG